MVHTPTGQAENMSPAPKMVRRNIRSLRVTRLVGELAVDWLTRGNVDVPARSGKRLDSVEP